MNNLQTPDIKQSVKFDDKFAYYSLCDGHKTPIKYTQKERRRKPKCVFTKRKSLNTKADIMQKTKVDSSFSRITLSVNKLPNQKADLNRKNF